MRRILFALAALVAFPAYGQVAYPPIDVSAVPTKAEVEAAQQAASAAQSLATAAQVAADAKCAAVPAIPSMETIGGSPGTNDGQCRPVNSVQPRITRSAAFTTVAGGTAVVTWPALPAVPLVFPIPNITNTATQGPLCYPVTGTITTTGATIKCFSTQSVTVSLLGAVVAPLTTAAAGVAGQVLAIPAS